MAVNSSFRNMVFCLGTITLVCGALLAGIYVITQEPIAVAAQAKTQKAIGAVTPGFERLQTLQNEDGVSYYVACDSVGDAVAYVVNASSVGFGGTLRMMVGFLPDGTIYDTAVLEHSETPGLGAKCTDEAFAGQFRKFDPSVRKLQVRKDGGDVDAITASTITSRAYCAALRNAVDFFASIAPAQESADTTVTTIETMEEGTENE